MKKKRLFFLICIAFVCIGCGKLGENNSVVNIDEIYDTDKKYPAQSYWRDDDIKKLGDKYYFTYWGNLYCWDGQTKTGTIMCSASNCAHNTAECNACFGCFGENYDYKFPNVELEIYNNRIYKIGYRLDEVTDFYIYSISLDGSEREQMGYLYSMGLDAAGGLTWTYDWVMIDGYYYGAYSSESEPYGLYKIRVDGEKTLVYDMSDKKEAGIHYVQGIGNNICFKMSWCENQETKSYRTTFVRYNTETEDVETLLENSIICEYCFYDEEHIFYSDITGRCHFMDLATGEDSCILEKDSVIGTISSDGKYLYVNNFNSYICVYDIHGTFIDKIYVERADILYGDENYLFLISSVEPGQPYSDGNEPSSEYLWILDKSQIGMENKQWMMMGLEKEIY